MKKKDLAVIGIGYWGKNLARNYNEIGVLHSICEMNPERRAQYQALYPHVHLESDYFNILASPEIQKVVIATPTRTHFKLAKEALIAGKDVFIEKAMCLCLSEAEELVSLAEANGKILMIGHLLHYHPAIAKIKELLASGQIGKILHFSFTRLNFGSVGEEESALWAFAPHDVSLLLGLSQQAQILSIDTQHHQFFSKEYIDQSILQIQLDNQMSAEIKVSWVYPYSERKFVIIGQSGSLVFDDLKEHSQKITLYKNEVVLTDKKLKFESHMTTHIPFELKEPLKEECLHFLECCQTRNEPMTSGHEGLRVMQILEAAKNELNIDLQDKSPILALKENVCIF